MRLYTVSAIDGWKIMKVKDRPDKPRLGKNGGPLADTSGLIGTYEACEAFVSTKRLTAVTVSPIRRWKGQ